MLFTTEMYVHIKRPKLPYTTPVESNFASLLALFTLSGRHSLLFYTDVITVEHTFLASLESMALEMTMSVGPSTTLVQTDRT